MTYNGFWPHLFIVMVHKLMFYTCFFYFRKWIGHSKELALKVGFTVLLNMMILLQKFEGHLHFFHYTRSHPIRYINIQLYWL